MTNHSAPALWPDCPDNLDETQLSTFREQGFIAFENVLSPDEVATARQRLSVLVRNLIVGESVRKGQVLSPPGGSYHVQFEPAAELDDTSDPDELELRVRKLMGYCQDDPFFHQQSHHHPRIQGILTSLLGPGSQMFQDMALVKPPHIGSIKPWHQDNAYFTVAPLDQVLGVWIALDKATSENGCMFVIPGGHQRGARRHYHDRDCEILPDRIDESEAIPIELEAGGAIFFYGMLPHQTPPNRSPHRRRALQWHYRGAHTRKLDPDEFDKLFAEADGTPATCRAAKNT